MGLLGGCSGHGAGGRSGAGEVRAQVKKKGARVRVAHSPGVEPRWPQQCPTHNDQLLVFCGYAQRKPDQKSAYAEAYGDALGKLRRFIGQKVTAEIEPDDRGGYHFSISSVEEESVLVRGVWEGEHWCEEYKGPKGRTHDCHVMISYPRLEYDRLLHQAHRALQQRLTKAIELHRQGTQALRGCATGRARDLLERARSLLASLDRTVTAGDTSSKVISEQVNADYQRSLQIDRESGRTVVLAVGLELDGQPQTGSRRISRIRDRVQRWLIGGGFKIRPGGLAADQLHAILAGDSVAARRATADKCAKLLLVLDLRCWFDSTVDDIFYSYAEGSLRLLWTEDGREVYTTNLPKTKGAMPFGKEDANDKALAELTDDHIEPAVEGAMKRLAGGKVRSGAARGTR
jgi:hypothetical protein